MMKEPWRARVAPLITVLFPPASNVRKNTRWQVCKRASTKLLSGKINGGSRGPHSDLRGQLVTAPRRCWGQQCGGSVSGRESVRDTPTLHPHSQRKRDGKWENVCREWPLSGWGGLHPTFFPPVLKKVQKWMIKRTTARLNIVLQIGCHVVICMCIIIEWKQRHRRAIWSKFRSALLVSCWSQLITTQVYDKLQQCLSLHYQSNASLFCLKSNVSAHLKC